GSEIGGTGKGTHLAPGRSGQHRQRKGSSRVLRQQSAPGFLRSAKRKVRAGIPGVGGSPHVALPQAPGGGKQRRTQAASLRERRQRRQQNNDLPVGRLERANIRAGSEAPPVRPSATSRQRPPTGSRARRSG